MSITDTEPGEPGNKTEQLHRNAVMQNVRIYRTKGDESRHSVLIMVR